MNGIMPRIVPQLTIPTTGIQIGSLPVGNIVKMTVNGQLRDFIIVHQGRPSTMYDISCDGTWLLMKDIYKSQKWNNNGTNDYENSTINNYLNGSFLGLLDANTRNAVKSVKIPYRPGAGSDETVNSGASGLACKVFLLSGYEVGWSTDDNYYFPHDGDKLAYFDAGTSTAADNKRIAKLNNSANKWWLRSPWCPIVSDTEEIWYVRSDGDYNQDTSPYSYGIRPALILKKTALVDDSGTIIG